MAQYDGFKEATDHGNRSRDLVKGLERRSAMNLFVLEASLVSAIREELEEAKGKGRDTTLLPTIDALDAKMNVKKEFEQRQAIPVDC